MFSVAELNLALACLCCISLLSVIASNLAIDSTRRPCIVCILYLVFSLIITKLTSVVDHRLLFEICRTTSTFALSIETNPVIGSCLLTDMP